MELLRIIIIITQFNFVQFEPENILFVMSRTTMDGLKIVFNFQLANLILLLQKLEANVVSYFV